MIAVTTDIQLRHRGSKKTITVDGIEIRFQKVGLLAGLKVGEPIIDTTTKEGGVQPRRAISVQRHVDRNPTLLTMHSPLNETEEELPPEIDATSKTTTITVAGNLEDGLHPQTRFSQARNLPVVSRLVKIEGEPQLLARQNKRAYPTKIIFSSFSTFQSRLTLLRWNRFSVNCANQFTSRLFGSISIMHYQCFPILPALESR